VPALEEEDDDNDADAEEKQGADPTQNPEECLGILGSTTGTTPRTTPTTPFVLVIFVIVIIVAAGHDSRLHPGERYSWRRIMNRSKIGKKSRGEIEITMTREPPCC
jgi:hypothetical protein